MLSTRGLLLLAWLVLIISLFWDPYSALLTKPDNIASPFHVTDAAVRVQDYSLVATPYSLSPRIFWTMLIPILPLFLMVFGHEAWRRICPLSFASQIPGYLRLRRFRNRFDRRTGHATRAIMLIDRKSWLARNAWYFQFGLLFVGVTLRLLVINSDRHSMGFALLAIIVAAIVTGILWGGKTWCNYFCPANIVQKIYTEPGGILESAPHFSRPALPQSMCRKPSPKGDVSACVACTASCGDIDLQGSYWNGVLDPQRRNVYYMFLGLILGFYGYYYLYSGSWDYYFSGIWTHEDGVLQRLFSPGFCIFGKIIAVPKIAAAPLTLAVACALSLLVGRALEALYRRLRSHEDGMTEKVIVHHCLSVAAWLSINAFYLFGGRPNILLLPALGGRLIDVAIVALTTVWLRRALQHSPLLYQQEGMASTLLEQLRKLKVNVSKFLDGRSLDKLKANEIYLLTKVLPGFSQQQKLSAYRKILDEAVTKGTTASASSLKLLEDFRHQMNITEEEHTQLLEELGVSAVAGADSTIMTAEERVAAIAHYRGLLAGLVASRNEANTTIGEILEDPSFLSTVAMLRQSLQIDEHEHQAAIDELLLQSGAANSKMEEAMEALVRQKSIRLCLEAAEISDPLSVTLLDLLLQEMEEQERASLLQVLSVLSSHGAEDHFQRYAADLAGLSDQGLAPVLDQLTPSRLDRRWRDVLHPTISAILIGAAHAPPSVPSGDGDRRWTDRKAILGSLNIAENLAAVLAYEDPLIQAIGLTVFDRIDPSAAQRAARQLLFSGRAGDHPILTAATERSLGIDRNGQVRDQETTLYATLHTGRQPVRRFALRQDDITIGRAADNDVVVDDEAISDYHLAIASKHGQAQLMRLGGGDVVVGGKRLTEGRIDIAVGSTIALGDAMAPTIVIEQDRGTDDEQELDVSPIVRLAMLAHNGKLSHLSLSMLADMALQVRIMRYRHGATIRNAIDRDRHCLIHRGQVQLYDPRHTDPVPGRVFESYDFVSADLLDQGSDLVPRVTSDVAVLIIFPPIPELKATVPNRSRSNIQRAELVRDSGAERSLPQPSFLPMGAD